MTVTFRRKEGQPGCGALGGVSWEDFGEREASLSASLHMHYVFVGATQGHHGREHRHGVQAASLALPYIIHRLLTHWQRFIES